MFTKDIKLTGRHAEIIKKYSKSTSAKEKISFTINGLKNESIEVYIFNDLIEAYMIAGMIGIIEGKKVSADKSSSVDAQIFAEVVAKRADYLNTTLKYMILSQTLDNDVDSRIKQAFSMKRDDDEEKELQKELDSYVRGGLEIIDSYFQDCKNYTDLGNKLLEFVSDYSLMEDD